MYSLNPNPGTSVSRVPSKHPQQRVGPEDAWENGEFSFQDQDTTSARSFAAAGLVCFSRGDFKSEERLSSRLLAVAVK